MFGIHDFYVFLAAGVTLNLMPGPDTMYIVGRSVAQGRQAGVFSALGISAGALVHTAAAAFGLSAILVASSVAFEVVRWVGAAYLVYLGAQLLFRRAPAPEAAEAAPPEAGAWTIFRQGMLTNLLNPKVALFFMAFLPQFVAPEQSASPVPFLVLGGVFVCTGTLWCLVVALLAASLSQTLRARAGVMNVVQRLTGLLFVGLGLRLAFQQSR